MDMVVGKTIIGKVVAMVAVLTGTEATEDLVVATMALRTMEVFQTMTNPSTMEVIRFIVLYIFAHHF